MSSRHVYRLAKYPQVAARIQYLTGMSDELIREKRDTVERELSRIAYANMADFISIKNGVPVLDWTKIHEYDEATRRDVLGAVKSVKFDKDGRVTFELYGKLEALAQLSKLNGFDKLEGSRSAGGEYERMSESELVAELSRQANELGLNITLSIDGTDGERSRHRDVVDGRKPTALVGAPRSLKNR
jgi:hypothetical protein